MRPPHLFPRFAMGIRTARVLGVVISLLLAGGTFAVTQTPVESTETTVAAGKPTYDLDLLAEVQEAQVVAARAAAIFKAAEAARVAEEARVAADRQRRLDMAKAAAERASRRALTPRQPGGNCTTGSANPGVSDPCRCESSNVQGWSPNGKYYGKYQYGEDDWKRNGGDPAKYGNATEQEQDAVAANTHYDAWPNC